MIYLSVSAYNLVHHGINEVTSPIKCDTDVNLNGDDCY